MAVPRWRCAVAAMGLLAGVLLGVAGPAAAAAFVLPSSAVGPSCCSGQTFAPLASWAPLVHGAATQAAGSRAGPRPGSAGPGGAGAAALLAVLAAAARGGRREAAASRHTRPSSMVVLELPGHRAFVGESSGQRTASQGLVARRSLYSCFQLYFKSGFMYKDRARREIRNRAYNIFMKNKYKKAMKKVLRYTVELEFGDLKPASVQEVMSEIKPLLDEACLTIDEVCVQGVLHRNTAARRKDRMCRAILRGCIAKGIAQKPEDPFKPAYEILGYELPKCYKLREPRPWQLPGWKSPWMLKREYDKWRTARAISRKERSAARKARIEAAEAAQAAAAAEA